VVRIARARARTVVSAGLAGLLAVGAIAGSVSGGNTRTIYIGDPDGSGLIRPSIASAGNQTGFRVLVRNDGSQNVTHVVIGVGTAAASAVGQPPGPSLPAGSTVVAMYGDGLCSVVNAGSGAMCTFDSLRAGTSVRDTIVVTTPSAGRFDAWVSVKLDENTSDAGANTDSFFAADNFVPSATSATGWADAARIFSVDPADGDHFGQFLLTDPGVPVGTGIAAAQLGPTKQGTLVTVPVSVDGTPVSVVEGADSASCAFGEPCFGALVTAHIADGATITPYLTWTMRWDATILPKGFSASQAGVIHFPDNGGTPVNIPNTKKNVCSATRLVDCVVSSDLTKTYFELVFRTASNGGIKGY
jgi:hypothetical protein